MKTNGGLLLSVLALVVVSAVGCDSDGATGTPDPVVLEFEGQVHSDAWDQPLQEAPVLLRVFRPDGSGGWNETLTDEAGRWTMQVELREGCEAGETLEAAAWITDGEHVAVDEDLGKGHSVLCDPDPRTLDYSLFRAYFREPVAVAGELQASQVAGFVSMCAVTEQGLYCWGRDHPAPVPVSSGSGLQGLDAGYYHVCALDAEGAAWCWGRNQNGVLGVPGVEETSEPVPVDTDLRFVELAANVESTCGRDTDGQLHCWGLYGADTPVPFGGDLRFEQISGQRNHMCGIEMGTERVWCWGANLRGAVGQEEGDRFEEPVLVEGVEGVQLLETGEMTTCALDESGTAHCWGWNCDGQLGRPIIPPTTHPIPEPVEGAPPLESLALGFGFSCGLTGSGEAWCWGNNARGELGTDIGSAETSSDPVPVSGDLRFRELAGGFAHACGLTDDGKLYCWGAREYLGTGLPHGTDDQGMMRAGQGWAFDPSTEPGPPVGGTCS